MRIETRTDANWQCYPLSEICTLIKDGTHGTHPRQASGIPLLSAKNITEAGNIYWDEADSYISEKEFQAIHRTWIHQPQDLLLTVVGTLGRRAIVQVGTRFTFQRSVAILRVDSTYLDSRYLYHYTATNQFQRQLQVRSNATAQAGVYLSELSQIEVAFPPLAEQRRIADILDTADAAIQHTDALIAKLKLIRSGLLHDILTRGLDDHGHLRDPIAHPDQFKETPLGMLPAAWDIVRVEQAGEVQLGRQRAPQHQTGRYTTPYLRVANVFDGWIDYSDVLSMDFTPSEQENYMLRRGDILLNEGQSLELVGRSAIYDEPPQTYCFQNTLVRFRCNDSATPDYCQAVFKYWLDSRHFTAVAKQTTSIAHLGADRFAKMYFPLPPLAEQHRIADTLRLSHARIRAEEAYRDKLKRIKQGLMDDLLTGRVRVPTEEGATA